MLFERLLVFLALALFLSVASYPIWKNHDPDYLPKVSMETKGDQCVAPVDFMRENHMKLLENWRDSVVRDGDRFHIMPDGTKVEKSLTKTCLGCHVSKKQFCEECHSFASVKPYCWECHVVPISGGHTQFSGIESKEFKKQNILQNILVRNKKNIQNNPNLFEIISD